MKTFILRLLFLTVFAFVIQALVYSAIKTILDKKSKFRMTRFFRDKKHDYFVLGNSRGVNSINEKYANENLKLDLINLSFNGEPYINIIDMLDEINSSNKNVVVYVEITGLVNNNFDNSYSYYIGNSDFIKRNFLGTVYNRLSLLRCNNEFLLRNIYYLRKSDDDWINGNTISKSVIDEANATKPFLIIKDKKEFIGRLVEMKKKCDASGNDIVFFLAPYFPEYRNKAIDYNDLKLTMTDKNNQFKFIDLNYIKLSDSMYADRVHTNLKGSIILTDSLITLSRKSN